MQSLRRFVYGVVTVAGALGAFVTLLTPAGGIPDVNIVTATFNENMEFFFNDPAATEIYSLTRPGAHPI